MTGSLLFDAPVRCAIVLLLSRVSADFLLWAICLLWYYGTCPFRPGRRNGQVQMCQLSNSHSPINKCEELLYHPAPQSQMGQGVTVDPIPVEELAPGFMKQFDINRHSGHIRPECCAKISGKSTGGNLPQILHGQELISVVFTT